jgi:ABC-2 type transport system permease protein
LAYFPPTAPFGMPALVSLGEVAWWQVAISAVLTILATLAVARLAATIYLRAILRTGQRVRLREVVRWPPGAPRRGSDTTRAPDDNSQLPPIATQAGRT